MERIKGRLYFTKEEAAKLVQGTKFEKKPDSIYRSVRGRGKVKAELRKDAFGRVLIPLSALVPSRIVEIMLQEEILDESSQT